MKCPQCSHADVVNMKFCGKCGSRLAVQCRECGMRNAPAQKFCGECGARLETGAPSRQIPAPGAYTPKHLAERIHVSRAAMEGERKQVTVLFADLKGSMELLADRDPREARELLDSVLEQMMEVVHRYEGTVNQVIGDGIMACVVCYVMSEDREGPGTRGARATRERLQARMDLEDAERVRPSIVSIPEDKWAQNFATSKETMLYAVDKRIGELRKKLGLLA
jgi:hypothetical protein